MTSHAHTEPHEPRTPSAGPRPVRSVGGVAGLQAAAGNRAVADLLHRSTGPAALQRLVQVTHVDYKPDVQQFVDWQVSTTELKKRLRPYLAPSPTPVPDGNTVIKNAKQRAALLSNLTSITDAAPDLAAPDVPTLADRVSAHIRGTHPLTAAELGWLTTAVRSALSATSFTIKKSSGDAFESLRQNAETTSQAKGTPNTIAVRQLPGPLQAPTASIAGLVRARNQALVATGFQLPRFPLVTGLANQASIGMDSIRSTHTNLAGWLPATPPPVPMPLQTLEHLVLAAAPPALAPQLLAGGDLTPVSRHVVAALIFRALGGIPTNRARMALHWGAYAQADAGHLYPFVEFAGPSTDVSRFVYDYATGAFYLSVHYQWHRGYNPFFRVTGLPEW